jgi:hypothetical protein
MGRHLRRQLSGHSRHGCSAFTNGQPIIGDDFIIAATARYEVIPGDLKGAYLHKSIKEDEPQIYMWVDKAVADILCEVSPEYRQHRRDDGRILVQLKRYLYGLPQAVHQFHKHHYHEMESLEFKSMRGDACVWMRGKRDMRVYVCAQVDDLLIV